MIVTFLIGLFFTIIGIIGIYNNFFGGGISTICGLFLLYITFKIFKQEKKDITPNINEDNETTKLEECLVTVKQTYENAKRDLSTGISKSELEKLYNSNLISDEDYIKTKDAIESLKMIVETYPQTIKSLQKQISEHKSTKN